jgi:hypothetical protein
MAVVMNLRLRKTVDVGIEMTVDVGIEMTVDEVVVDLDTSLAALMKCAVSQWVLV